MRTNKSTPALAAAIPASVKKYAVWVLVAIVIVIGVARIASYVRSDDTLAQSTQHQGCPAFSEEVQRCDFGEREVWIDTGTAKAADAQQLCVSPTRYVSDNEAAQNARLGFKAPKGQTRTVAYWLRKDPSGCLTIPDGKT